MRNALVSAVGCLILIAVAAVLAATTGWPEWLLIVVIGFVAGVSVGTWMLQRRFQR